MWSVHILLYHYIFTIVLCLDTRKAKIAELFSCACICKIANIMLCHCGELMDIHYNIESNRIKSHHRTNGEYASDFAWKYFVFYWTCKWFQKYFCFNYSVSLSTEIKLNSDGMGDRRICRGKISAAIFVFLVLQCKNNTLWLSDKIAWLWQGHNETLTILWLLLV